MTDRIREQMSALLDGELPQDEVGLLVRRLERDAGLRRSFGNYVLAGEALGSPGGQLASAGFAARVSAAIDEGAAEVAVLDTPQRLERHWSRPFAAVAVAASAAFMAVLLVRPGVHGPATIAQATLERARTGFASLQQAGAAASPTPAHSQRLAGYLVAHSQFASPLSRRNVWSGVLASDPGISRVAFETIEAP
jgi:sigma-E factor negative regulatory protein RseA